MTYFDLKTRISLRTEEKMAETHQMHETLVIVISQALGGKSSSAPTAPPEPAAFPKTADDLEARLMRNLGG